MSTPATPDLEILVHVTAPTSATADTSYRALATAARDFVPVRRLDLKTIRWPPRDLFFAHDDALQEEFEIAEDAGAGDEAGDEVMGGTQDTTTDPDELAELAELAAQAERRARREMPAPLNQYQRRRIATQQETIGTQESVDSGLAGAGEDETMQDSFRTATTAGSFGPPVGASTPRAQQQAEETTWYGSFGAPPPTGAPPAAEYESFVGRWGVVHGGNGSLTEEETTLDSRDGRAEEQEEETNYGSFSDGFRHGGNTTRVDHDSFAEGDMVTEGTPMNAPGSDTNYGSFPVPSAPRDRTVVEEPEDGLGNEREEAPRALDETDYGSFEEWEMSAVLHESIPDSQPSATYHPRVDSASVERVKQEVWDDGGGPVGRLTTGALVGEETTDDCISVASMTPDRRASPVLMPHPGAVVGDETIEDDISAILAGVEGDGWKVTELQMSSPPDYEVPDSAQNSVLEAEKQLTQQSQGLAERAGSSAQVPSRETEEGSYRSVLEAEERLTQRSQVFGETAQSSVRQPARKPEEGSYHSVQEAEEHLTQQSQRLAEAAQSSDQPFTSAVSSPPAQSPPAPDASRASTQSPPHTSPPISTYQGPPHRGTFIPAPTPTPHDFPRLTTGALLHFSLAPPTTSQLTPTSPAPSPAPSTLPSLSSPHPSPPLSALIQPPHHILPPPPSTSSNPPLIPIRLYTDLHKTSLPTSRFDSLLKSQSRELRKWERGHWRVDLSSWDRGEEKVIFWKALRAVVGEGRLGGVNVMLEGDEVRVYCWGGVVREVWCVLFVYGYRRVGGVGWWDAGGECVLRF